ncbi:MAG: putative capsular polysaccharide synthesis family protein [Cyanobacteria bacterium P01_A01_bin.114]
MKKDLVQRIVRQNFYLNNWYQNYQLHQKNGHSKGKILIYQMGKVGSTSLYESLKWAAPSYGVYHLHCLQSSTIQKMLAHYKKIFKKGRNIDEHVIHSQYLRRQLNRGLEHQSEKWKVITLIRDPIARNLSSFFHELRYQPDILDAKTIDSSTLKVLLEEYFQRYPDSHHPFDWFDLELKAVFNIDLFSADFSPVDGYKIYTNDDIDLLVLKLEHLDACAQHALHEFLGIEKILLRAANKGDRTQSGELYKKFKQRAILPTDYLNKIYQSPKVKHFYSPIEIDRFYRQWTHSADV